MQPARVVRSKYLDTDSIQNQQQLPTWAEISHLLNSPRRLEQPKTAQDYHSLKSIKHRISQIRQAQHELDSPTFNFNGAEPISKQLLKEKLDLVENLEWLLLLDPSVEQDAFTNVHLFEEELVALGLKYTGSEGPEDDISEDDRLHALVLLMDKESESFRQQETRNLTRSLKAHLARNKPAESFFHMWMRARSLLLHRVHVARSTLRKSEEKHAKIRSVGITPSPAAANTSTSSLFASVSSSATGTPGSVGSSPQGSAQPASMQSRSAVFPLTLFIWEYLFYTLANCTIDVTLAKQIISNLRTIKAEPPGSLPTSDGMAWFSVFNKFLNGDDSAVCDNVKFIMGQLSGFLISYKTAVAVAVGVAFGNTVWVGGFFMPISSMVQLCDAVYLPIVYAANTEKKRHILSKILECMLLLATGARPMSHAPLQANNRYWLTNIDQILRDFSQNHEFFWETSTILTILGIEREQISHVVNSMKKFLLGRPRKEYTSETIAWCKQLRTYLKSWDKSTTDSSAISRGWQSIQSQWNVPLINSVAFDGSYIYYCVANKSGHFLVKSGTGYNSTVPQRVYTTVIVPAQFGIGVELVFTDNKLILVHNNALFELDKETLEVVNEIGKVGPYLAQAPVRMTGDGKLLYVIGQIVPTPEQIKKQKAQKVRTPRTPKKSSHPVTPAVPIPSLELAPAIAPQPSSAPSPSPSPHPPAQLATSQEGLSAEGMASGEADVGLEADDSMEEGLRDDAVLPVVEPITIPPIHEEPASDSAAIEEVIEEVEPMEEEEDEEDNASWVNMVVDVYEIGGGLKLLRRVVIDKYQQQNIPGPVNTSAPNDGLGSFQPTSAIDDPKMQVQSISSHPNFSNYSFDELRANYYKAMITPSASTMVLQMLRSAQFFSDGKHLIVALNISGMPDFKYGNGSATMTSVFSLDNGKHLSDTLSPHGPLDWGMAIGTTYYDFSTLFSFSTSLPRVFEDDTQELQDEANCFEITASHIMSKIASFHHQTITKKVSGNVPQAPPSEWFNFDVLESEENILSVLAISNNYAHRVFTGSLPDKELDLASKDAIPPPVRGFSDAQDPEHTPRSESEFTAADISSYVLVLSNALRLLKMLVYKRVWMQSYDAEVKPMFRNLENHLLGIIQFNFTSSCDNHYALLSSIPFTKIYSIVKECCEIYVLGLELFYPSTHSQMEILNVLLNDKKPNNKYNGNQLLVDMLLEHHYNNSSFAKWAFSVPNDDSRVAISKSIFLYTAKVFFSQTRAMLSSRVAGPARTLTLIELMFMDIWKETAAEAQGNPIARSFLAFVTNAIARETTTLLSQCQDSSRLEGAIAKFIPPFFISISGFVNSLQFAKEVAQGLCDLVLVLHDCNQRNRDVIVSESELQQAQSQHVRLSAKQGSSLLLHTQLLHWLLDFEMCISFISALCFAPMIHGEPITMMEIQNKHWFVSDLLKGGFETVSSQNRFLTDLVSMTHNNEADTLVEYLSELLTKNNPLGKRGGEEVAKAERYAFAVLLKHTCLVQKAAAIAQHLHKKRLYKINDANLPKKPEEQVPVQEITISPQLKYVWNTAFAIRVWVIQQQQSNKSICQQVISKCELLLSLASFNQVKASNSPIPTTTVSHPLRKNLPISSSLLNLRKETSPKKPHPRLSRASSDYLDLGRTTDDSSKSASQQNLMKNYQIWKSLRTKLTDSMADDLRDPRSIDGESTNSNDGVPQAKPEDLILPKSICNAAINFIQDANIASMLKSIIQCHVQRADSRIVALTQMKRLLAHSSVCSMRDQLRLVFTSFVNDDSDDSTLNPPPSPSSSAEIPQVSTDTNVEAPVEEIPSELERKGFHYLNDVQGCGGTRRTVLQSGFQDLFLLISSLLTSPPPSPRPAPLLLDDQAPLSPTRPSSPPSSQSLPSPRRSPRSPTPPPQLQLNPTERERERPQRVTPPKLPLAYPPSPSASSLTGTNGHVLNLAIMEGFCKIFYSDKDHDMLDRANILHSLSFLAQMYESPSYDPKTEFSLQRSVSESAWCLFRLMAVNTMRSRKTDIHSKELNRTQKSLVDLIYSQFTKAGEQVEAFIHNEGKSNEDDEGLLLLDDNKLEEFLRCERRCYHYMELLVYISAHAHFPKYFATKKTLSELFNFYVTTTPRIQRLVLRLFARIAYAVDPESVSAPTVLKTSEQTSQAPAILTFFFHEVAKSIPTTSFTNPSSITDSDVRTAMRKYVVNDKMRSFFDRKPDTPRNTAHTNGVSLPALPPSPAVVAPVAPNSPPTPIREPNSSTPEPLSTSALSDAMRTTPPAFGSPSFQPSPLFAPTNNAFAFGSPNLNASPFGSPPLPTFGPGTSAFGAAAAPAFRSTTAPPFTAFAPPAGFNPATNLPLRLSTVSPFPPDTTPTPTLFAPPFASTTFPNPLPPPEAIPPFNTNAPNQLPPFRFIASSSSAVPPASNPSTSPPAPAPISSLPTTTPVAIVSPQPAISSASFSSSPLVGSPNIGSPNIGSPNIGSPTLPISPNPFTNAFSYNRAPGPTMFPPVSTTNTFNAAANFVFGSAPATNARAPATAPQPSPLNVSTTTPVSPPTPAPSLAQSTPPSPGIPAPAPQFATFPPGSLFAAASSFVNSTPFSPATPSPFSTTPPATTAPAPTPAPAPAPAPATSNVSSPPTTANSTVVNSLSNSGGVSAIRNIWTKPVYPLEGVRFVKYGAVRQSVASDIVSLLRILFELPEWKPHLTQMALKALASLPALLAEFTKNKTISDEVWLQKMHTIIAIFFVFGGNHDLMYQGGSVLQKVSAEPEPQIGVVIKTDPLLGTVSFFNINKAGGGSTLQKNVPFEQVTPIPGVKFNPSSFVLTPEILGYLQPLFTGSSKNDDEDVVKLKFDDDNEPDLELCEALRSRCVVSEVRRSALKALGELLQYSPSVEAFSESVLVNRLGELSLKASFNFDLDASRVYYTETSEKLLDVSKYHWLRILPYHPLCYLPTPLPKEFCREKRVGDEKQMSFFMRNYNRVSFTRDSSEQKSAMFRANCAVLGDKIPFYYFEVFVGGLGLSQESVEIGFSAVNHDNDDDHAESPLVAIASNGKIRNMADDEYLQIEGKNFTFGNADVIGCGWNRKENTVFFTKNGEFIEKSEQRHFEHRTFYPCVKFNTDGFAIANFGQSKFKFNITDYVWTKVFQIGEALPVLDIHPTIFSVGDNVTEEFGHSVLGKLFTVKSDSTTLSSLSTPGISAKGLTNAGKTGVVNFYHESTRQRNDTQSDERVIAEFYDADLGLKSSWMYMPTVGDNVGKTPFSKFPALASFGPYRLLRSVFETSVWHTYHHARQASVTLLCNWVGDLSVAALGGNEHFVNYFISTVSNEAAEFDLNKTGATNTQVLTSLLEILSKFLRAEAAKTPELTMNISEEASYNTWPLASLILRACGDTTGQHGSGKKLDGKLAVMVTKLVFEDSSAQFRQIFSASVFRQLMDKAMFSLPPIPPLSHSLSPLSEAHLLKIELLRLATVVVKSVPPTHPVAEVSKLEWLQNELDIHTKDSQQHTYLKVLFDLLFAFLRKGWKNEVLNLGQTGETSALQTHKLELSVVEKAINVYKFCHNLASQQEVAQPFVCEAYMSLLPKVRRSPHPIIGKYVAKRELIQFPGADSLKVIVDNKCEITGNCQLVFFLNEEVDNDQEIDESNCLQSFKNWRGGATFDIPADKIYWKFVGEGRNWGFDFAVFPKYRSEQAIHQILSLEEHCTKILNFVKEYRQDRPLDTQLMIYTYNLCQLRNLDPLLLVPATINPNEDEKRMFPLLATKTPEHLQMRFAIIQLFNKLLHPLLPLFLGCDKSDELKEEDVPQSLVQLIYKFKYLIFTNVKLQFVEKSLSANSNNKPRGPTISINRLDVSSQNMEEIPMKKTVFMQTYQQLKDVPQSTFWIEPDARAWFVKLIGEGATDAGGPYFEILSQMCKDIQSPPLSLFIPCPNAQIATEQEGSVTNRDKFVPNPSKKNNEYLGMYNFIGRLLGIALRSKNTLSLSFPSIVWKPLVGLKPTFSDLRSIDHFCCQFLDGLRDAEDNGITEENFASIIFENFTTSLSDGSHVDLKLNGGSIPVTYANRLEYAKLVEEVRLREANAAINAIRTGFGQVVPLPLVALFNWDELEIAICGKPNIDINVLRDHSRLEGYETNDPTILMLWAVLESFTPEERCMFLRFACGRERLPNNRDFRLVIAKLHAEDVLPRASTCSSMFKLPSYSSKAIMRDKILLAITSCIDIDNDFRVYT